MFGTTVPDSTQNTRASFSEHFSGFTLLKNLKAPESGWRQFNALFESTEVEFGPRQSARKALLSISLSAKSYDQKPAQTSLGCLHESSPGFFQYFGAEKFGIQD
jgi:hypothetical protein